MHIRSLLVAASFVLLASVVAASAQGAAGAVEAKLQDKQVVVTVGGQLFTCYKFDPSQKYPYFWPANGPASGKSVTTETSEPYPHHHSLFFGCDQVNGGNYWQDTNERGQIISQGPRIVEPSGSKVVFTDEGLWKQPGKDPIIRDRRQIVGIDHLRLDSPVEIICRFQFEDTSDDAADDGRAEIISVAPIERAKIVQQSGKTPDLKFNSIEGWADAFIADAVLLREAPLEQLNRDRHAV